MNKKLLKLSLVCITGAMIITATPQTAMAYEDSVAGFPYDKNPSSVTTVGSTTINFSINDIPIPGFVDVCIADVDTNLLIRKDPSEDGKILGKLPKNAGCTMVEESKNGWTKIKAITESGEEIIGYVKSEYLITGAQATQMAKEVGNFVVSSNTNGLNIRKEPSTDSSVIDQIAEGEEVLLDDEDPYIVTDDPEYPYWVKVRLDSDTEEEGSVGYIAKKYVEISFQLAHALSIEEIQYGAGVSNTRIKIVDFARDYLGGRYVWGGTSLSRGVDCSGFTQAIYRNFGISIPRTSREQARYGDKISVNELKPGDLVFYGSSSYINHVAMYIGNGKVIHASNHRDGIKISNVNYRTPVKCVRIIND